MHKLGTTGRLKVSEPDVVVGRTGDVDVYICFRVIIVVGCVDASNYVDEVDNIDVLGDTWRMWSVGTVDWIEQVGDVDVCIWFGVLIVVRCVDASLSFNEVDKIDVVDVKSEDGWDDVLSDSWEMIGSLSLKLSVVGNEVGFKYPKWLQLFTISKGLPSWWLSTCMAGLSGMRSGIRNWSKYNRLLFPHKPFW